MWSSSARKVVATLPAGTAPVTALAFAPDASSLAIGDDGGGVRFLDPRTGKSKAKPLALSESSPAAIEYSPEGSRVAVGRPDGRTQIFALRSGEQLGPPLAANASAINDVSFSADGRLLATAGLDRTGALWRLDGNRAIGTVFRGQRGAITEATYTPDGTVVLTAGADGSVAASNPATRVDRAPVPARRRGALGRGLARRLDAGGRRHRAGASPCGRSINPPPSPSASTSAVPGHSRSRSRPTAKQLAVAVDGDRGDWELGTGRGHVRFVDPATGAEMAARLDFSGGVPIGVAFSPDGKVLAVTADNNLVQLYDAGTHERIGKPLENVDSAMLSTAFATDSERLATGTTSGSVLQWNVRRADRHRAGARGRRGRDRRSCVQPRRNAPGDEPRRFLDDAAVARGQRSPVRRHLRRRGRAVHRADFRRSTISSRTVPPSPRAETGWSPPASTARPSPGRWIPDQWRKAACAIAGRELTEGRVEAVPARSRSVLVVHGRVSRACEILRGRCS